MRYRRGIDVRAQCRDEAGRILVVDGADGLVELPGGPVGHGEHPADALARWGATQTAGMLAIRHPLSVITDVVRSPRAAGGAHRLLGLPAARRTGWLHRDTIVFSGEVAGDAGALRWVAEADVAAIPLAASTAAALGRGGEGRGPLSAGRGRALLAKLPGGARTRVVDDEDGRRQRFAAYGHVTDSAGNVLLTRIAAGYPGAGFWHLPGGGTDFGEPAEAGLRREIVEETGQHGEIGELLRVSHRHQVRGHGGRPVDWHGVRVVYAVRVREPSTPRVLERGGSTDRAAWFSVDGALELRLTEVAHDALLEDGAH
jgi:ADP-ribose pyrophosphatase YjhB (NUDIX family)